MKTAVHIIVLRTIRHTDRHSILTAYSLEHGRMAFAIPAGNGREASRRRALLMPMSMIECVADIRAGRDVHFMHEPRAVAPLMSLRAHPVKSAIALFMAEVFGAVVREGLPDESLYTFMSSMIMALDSLPGSGLANFHVCFLMGLGRMLGIEPDYEGYRDGMFFDMLDGRFRLSPPMHRHFLNPQQSKVVNSLSRLTLLNMHRFRMTRSQRNELTDMILEYYSLHAAGVGNLKSLEVVRELF
ncbi:MAG: DNA repair protein RecO [Bacteroides sp.]|nr:DNA repair protein RecO [Bacteroides sp.]MCM1413632.1 DNA repair protein RecO [Bacteroides sp.]MCM1471151.1 DNA repair protein RecO [Bacteroides sp.]